MNLRAGDTRRSPIRSSADVAGRRRPCRPIQDWATPGVGGSSAVPCEESPFQDAASNKQQISRSIHPPLPAGQLLQLKLPKASSSSHHHPRKNYAQLRITELPPPSPSRCRRRRASPLAVGRYRTHPTIFLISDQFHQQSSSPFWLLDLISRSRVDRDDVRRPLPSLVPD